MKKIMAILPIIVFIACGYNFSCADSISINLKTDKNEYIYGECILLDIDITNRSNKIIKIVDDIPGDLFIVNSKNAKMKYKYFINPKGGVIRIDRGQKWEAIYEVVNEGFDLPPDEYEIYLNLKKASKGKDSLKSNLLKIKIKENIGQKTYEKMAHIQNSLGKSLTGEAYQKSMYNLLVSIDQTDAYYNTVYMKYLRSLCFGGLGNDNETAKEKIKEFIKQNENNLFGRFAVILLETVVSNSGLRHREIISYMSEYKKALVNNELKDFVDYRIYVLQNI